MLESDLVRSGVKDHVGQRFFSFRNGCSITSHVARDNMYVIVSNIKYSIAKAKLTPLS